jgi:hypothetical protein
MTHHRNSGFGSFLSGALAAGAVAAYFLFGSRNARRNREKIDEWMQGKKDEVKDKVDDVKTRWRNAKEAAEREADDEMDEDA